MYFNLGALRIGKEYVALEEDIHISSIVGLGQRAELKPQHMHTCMAWTVFRNGGGWKYVIEQLSSGYASKFNGLSVANAIVRIKKSRKFPLLIMNSISLISIQTVTLKRGWSIARVSEASSITEITVPDKQTSQIFNEKLEQVNVPEEFKPEIDGLLKRNRDLFISEDKHLGRTDTVNMRIDTGTHEPIKRRPYRTPLKQRKMVDLAIEEMMQEGIIERSNSPLGFPIVLVEKGWY